MNRLFLRLTCFLLLQGIWTLSIGCNPGVAVEEPGTQEPPGGMDQPSEESPDTDSPPDTDNPPVITGGKLVEFVDPDSDFETTEVYDVEDEIFFFDRESASVIWAADGVRRQEGTWTVDGNFLSDSRAFQVRFGNKDGRRRAFFTETVPATICDLEVQDGMFLIFPTNVPVPQ